MKNIFLFLTTLFAFEAYAQTLERVSENADKLNISIDPRIEALGVIQIISEYPFVERSSSYGENIMEHFKDYKTLPAIELTNGLYNNGFSYDAPPNFMLHLGQLPALNEQAEYADYLVSRANGRNKLEEYRLAIQDFVKETKFEKFWRSNIPFYKEIVQQTKANMDDIDLVGTMEEYYNESQNSYNIILCPSVKNHNYGAQVKNENGGHDIYSCNALSHTKGSVPSLSGSHIMYLVWHEFGHSFVNPLAEKHQELVAAYSHLFDPIKDVMSRQAYTNWETCLNEHIVRAVVIRLLQKQKGKEAANGLIEEELNGKFIYIQALVDKLEEYEIRRDAENITFSDFYPQLLTAFDDMDDQVDLRFRGPMDRIFSEQTKLAIIYPTTGYDSVGLTKLKEYVEAMSDFISTRLKMEEVNVMADSTALDTSLADYSIIVYGTFESNSFLSSLRSSLPFGVEGGKIYADKEYTDPRTKLISCFPNPHNPQKGMTIYTALNNVNILDINKVHHGNEDYILFLDSENILHRGNYNKEKDWKY